VYAPDGRRIREIRTEKNASDCAFGEAGKSLFVTARDMLIRLSLDAQGAN
jgi:gluconolactonase